MKKLLPITLFAICFAIIAEERASAWVNSRFGIGTNWSWQSGGNNLFWGLFRDGQPCGPDIHHVAVPVYPRSGCGNGNGYGNGYGNGFPGGPAGFPGGYPAPGVGAFPGGPGPALGPVSNNANLFGGPEHAIQAPTPPGANGTQPVNYYHQANYGYYPNYYRNYR